MLDTKVYNFMSIVVRNANVLNNKSIIYNRDILQMMSNSGIRKTAKNIDVVINQIVDEIVKSNSFESVKIDDRKNIVVNFKEVK